MHLSDWYAYVPKIASTTMLLAIMCVVGAQESSRIELPYRVKYENSPELPNGIAFHMTLLHLDHFNTNYGPADAAEWVAQELGLSRVDAHNFVSQALTTLYLIDSDVSAQLESHACQFAGKGVATEDKYAALQQTYDIEKAIYDHYYDQTKASLDRDTAERLQQWMDKEKLSIGHMEIDFEKADQQKGRDPADRFSKMCADTD
jgi:hypothetical protein